MSKKPRIMISLTEKNMADLEKLANEKGMTKSVIITLALEEYLKKGESNASK